MHRTRRARGPSINLPAGALDDFWGIPMDWKATEISIP